MSKFRKLGNYATFCTAGFMYMFLFTKGVFPEFLYIGIVCGFVAIWSFLAPNFFYKRLDKYPEM